MNVRKLMSLNMVFAVAVVMGLVAGYWLVPTVHTYERKIPLDFAV